MPGFVETLEGQASSFGLQANGESVVASCILFLLLPACGEKKGSIKSKRGVVGGGLLRFIVVFLGLLTVLSLAKGYLFINIRVTKF